MGHISKGIQERKDLPSKSKRNQALGWSWKTSDKELLFAAGDSHFPVGETETQSERA